MNKVNHRNTADQIHTLLKKQLNPQQLKVIDQSHLHEGHQEAMKNPNKGHFHITIKLKENNLSRIQQHRSVYQALKAIMPNIHALSIEIVS